MGDLGLGMPLDFQTVISKSIILEYKKYSWNMTGFKTTPGISRPLMLTYSSGDNEVMNQRQNQRGSSRSKTGATSKTVVRSFGKKLSKPGVTSIFVA